jgi:parallel beta-helix repeat protein
MFRKAFSVVIMELLFLSTIMLAFNVRLTMADAQTVYINTDGSITPAGVPIVTSDNLTYDLTGDITYPTYLGIVVWRNHVIIDGKGYTVQGGTSQYQDGINCMYKVSNVTIKNTNIKSCGVGIRLYGSDYSSIVGNNITDSGGGIFLSGCNNNNIYRNSMTNNYVEGIGSFVCSNNNISENSITASRHYGIYSCYDSNATIFKNSITANNVYGIFLGEDSNNSIVENNITVNNYGIWLEEASSGNTIFHNSFINNNVQVGIGSEMAGYTNVWDDGYPSGGNYWSNHTSPDLFHGPFQNVTGSDGTVDRPYTIDSNNTDNYPLMGTFSSFDSISTVSNFTISSFQINQTTISFNVTGPPDTTGFCILTIPHSILPPSYIVTVDDHLIPYNAIFENDTMSVIYFTYEHSTYDVTITGCSSEASEGLGIPYEK